LQTVGLEVEDDGTTQDRRPTEGEEMADRDSAVAESRLELVLDNMPGARLHGQRAADRGLQRPIQGDVQGAAAPSATRAGSNTAGSAPSSIWSRAFVAGRATARFSFRHASCRRSKMASMWNRWASLRWGLQPPDSGIQRPDRAPGGV